MWYENYIGIPFLANGRDRAGLDCWGLVRLIYEEQYQINLPSFTSDYHIDDDSRIKELISQYQEGWESIESPESGCVVLFRILGEVVHIGLMISDKHFIHVREGSNTVIDNIEGFRWKNRVTGFYKYKSDKTPIVLNAVPHPLKTHRVTKLIEPGTTLEQIYSEILEENKNAAEISKSAVIMVNGVVIPRTAWNTTIVKSSDVVEYRAVAGKDVLKLVVIIAVAYFAPEFIGSFGTIGGVSVATGTFANFVLSAVAVTAASALLNAIAPVRPPKDNDPGTPEQQNLINGANNTFNPYGAIPVVLGKIRFTPPVGAKGFMSYPEQRTSYLNMLLLWGYGPLTLSDFRIGEVGWNEYQFNTTLTSYTDTLTDSKTGRITFDRKGEFQTPAIPITAAQQLAFDEIYGVDVDQQYSGIELVGPEYNGQASGDKLEVTLYGGTTITIDRYTGEVYTPPSDVTTDLNWWYTDSAGSSGTGPGDAGGASGDGGGCPAPWQQILLHDLTTISAGELLPGMLVRTQHETTLEWGNFTVTAVTIEQQERVEIIFEHTKFVCSLTHKFYNNNGWIQAFDIKQDMVINGHTVIDVRPYQPGETVKITVEGAHTYICEQMLSHNIK